MCKILRQLLSTSPEEEPPILSKTSICRVRHNNVEAVPSGVTQNKPGANGCCLIVLL